MHWAAYTGPVIRGEVKAEDLRRLWRNIEPHLRRSLETVFLREVTRSGFRRKRERGENFGWV